MILIFEIMLGMLFIAIWSTQIAIPAWRGTPLCPFLRRERTLRRQLSIANQKQIEAELAAELKNRTRATRNFNKERDN